MKKVKTKDELFEAVVEQFTSRLREGKNPQIETYLERYPKFALELEELLASVEMIEGLKQSGRSPQQSLQRRMDTVLNLKRIGDYDIVREVGRGGMGIVFEAVHGSLGQRVAIKVMPSSSLRDEKYVERFRREAQAAAKLHHTNIVSVFGVGEHDGHHYYVMEFIDGENLSGVVRALTKTNVGRTNSTNQDFTRQGIETIPAVGVPVTIAGANTIADGADETDVDAGFEVPELNVDQVAMVAKKVNLPHGRQRFRWAADICSQVADAMAYAHAQGTLHRDIKPSNLLLDQDGQVWITDFGLVKDVTHQTLTGTGDIIGTPQYMCPESFEGKYDCRSETYCLGLTLYELVMLRPAFAEMSTGELIKTIMSSSPVSPRKVDSRIPLDLCTIIDKAIARDPNQRYQTAHELRDDLRAFLNGRTISARRPSAWEQAWRWARRNPLAASLASLSVVLLGLVATTALIGYWVSSSALADVQKQANELKTQKQQIQQLLDTSKSKSERIQEGLRKAENSVAITIDMFDAMFKQIVSGSESTELTIDSFSELAGVETAVTSEDAAFLRSMLKYYEKFADQNSNNEQIKDNSARVYRRVANVYHLVGDFDQAIAAYKRSAAALEAQMQRSAGGVDETVAFVQTRNEMAMALRKSQSNRRGQLWKADPTQILSASESLLLNHPRFRHPKIQFELARTLQIMGTNESLMRVLANAGAMASGANRRGSRPPQSPATRNHDDVSQKRQSYLERAITILDGLLKGDSDNVALKAERAKCYYSLSLYQRGARMMAAKNSLSIATREFEMLHEQFPENAEYSFFVAIMYASARSTADGNVKELLNKAVGILETLTEKHPRVLEYHQLYAISTLRQAFFYAQSGDMKLAFANLETASNSLSTLREQTPVESYLHRALARRIDEVEARFKNLENRPDGFMQQFQRLRRQTPSATSDRKPSG